MREARARLRQRFRERMDRLFAPRELMLRTDGRIAYFRLSRRLQKAATLALLGVTAWAALGTTGFLIDHSRIAARDDEIARLRDVGARNRALQARIAKVRADAGALEASRLRVGGLTADLDKAGTEIEDLRRRLDAAQRRTTRLVADRASLQATGEALTVKLAALRERMAALKSEQQRISDSLTARMQARLDGLEKALAMTTLDIDGLMARAAFRLAGVGGRFIALHAGYHPDAQQSLPGTDRLVREIDRFEQLQLLLRSLPLASPLDSYRIESGFGMRNDPFTRKPTMHDGLDLVNELNTPVLSPAPGVVVYAGLRDGYGRLVEIDHGFGISTRYGHMRAIAVSLGQQVGYRQEIGRIGTSGRSTGPHLHYEVRLDGKPLDPAKFLEAGRHVFQGVVAEASQPSP